MASDEYNYRKSKKHDKKRVSNRGNAKKDKLSKNISKDYYVPIDDSEMLRFQGLIRCDNCNNPCPLDSIVCPTCNHEKEVA